MAESYENLFPTYAANRLKLKDSIENNIIVVFMLGRFGQVLSSDDDREQTIDFYV